MTEGVDQKVPGQTPFVFRKVDTPSFLSQPNGYDCVPAAFLNAAQIIGFEPLDRKTRQSADFGLVRRAFGWPAAPAYVDMHELRKAVNQLPPLVNGEENAIISSKGVIYGGNPPRFVDHFSNRSLSPELFQAYLWSVMRTGMGIILGFNDHASL